MTTATGDVARDYAAAGDVSPLTDASFTYLDPNGAFRLQVLSNAVKAVSTSDFQPLWRYNGSMSASATLRAKMEVAVNNNGDFFVCYLCNSSATGYALEATGTTVSIYPMTTGTIDTGNRIGTAGTVALSSGNIIMLELNQTTHTLVAYENGTPISGPGGVDSTTTTGLAFGFGMDIQNNNGSSFRSLAGDGIASVDTLMPQICM